MVARTIVIKTADGTEHTFHVVRRTGVHGAQASWRGLKEGSEVVAHYTARGTRETAVEIDNVGKEGLHAMEGAVVKVDQGAKTVVVKSADGAERTFRTTDNAVVSLGKGSEKAAKVTVYYTEDGGKAVVHFFQRL